ncbi:MAG: tocopherol cyclase family protein [Coprobacillus sp.]
MISYEQELQIHVIKKIPAFEGWYFRVVDDKISLAVIIGIAKTKDKQEAFIQVFHTLSQKMEKVSYDINEFQYQEIPFMLMIKKSIFKKHYIHIEDSRLSTIIDIEFSMPLHIKQTKYAPTIMGPFGYLKNMQCNHAIVNLECPVHGHIKYQNELHSLQGILYQEKDWGYSFPKKYVWIQSNCCIEKKANLFISSASIPMKLFEFTGVIMVLTIGNKEYQFASYYGAFVVKAQMVGDIYYLDIKQGKYKLEFEITLGPVYILDAPEQGIMLRNVQESLLGEVKLTMYEHSHCSHVLTFHHCGIEIENFFKKSK